MRINTNMAAMNTWRSLSINSGNMQKSLERLSSGFRINKAADDAAGLAVSEKMRAQIRGINMATRNAQDGVSLVQTAEGGASKIGDMLQRMRELAVQANTDNLSSGDKGKLNLEFTELAKEINRTAMATKFNDQNVITGAVVAGSSSTSLTQTAVTAANGWGATTIATTSATTSEWSGTGLGAGDYQIVIKAGAGTTTADNYFQLQKKDANAVFQDVAGARTSDAVATTVTGSALGLTGITISTTTASGTTTAGTVVGSLNIGTSTVVTPAHGDSTATVRNISVGPNSGDTVSLSFASLNGGALGITSATGTDTLATGATDGNVDITTNASGTIKMIDAALETVNNARATMGAFQNRLENSISMLQTQSENITAAESRIRDVDMASEMAQFTKFQVLQQASTSMLAQANQLPQGIMSLLR